MSDTRVVGIPQPYGHANFWMRLLSRSPTKTFPLPSTATPQGTLNCPSPLPPLPQLVRNVPLCVNFWMAALTVSATKTFPLPSTATPVGQLKLDLLNSTAQLP